MTTLLPPLANAEANAIANQHVPFFGCFAQQHPATFQSLNRLLLAHDFTNIVEFGTHDGGLSTLLALYCLGSRQPARAGHDNEPSLYKNQTHHKSPKQFYSFDNVLRDIPRIELLVAMGAKFAQVDLLNDAKVTAAIGEIIAQPGTTLVLCDGGNKVQEVALYAPFLKKGDFIMAHDWARDRAHHKQLKESGTWCSWESWWDEAPIDAGDRQGLKRPCEMNGVVQVYSDEFDGVAWFCGRKQ